MSLTSGKYAVACVGSKEWMREAAIGDGITSATMALVTRTKTKEEAEAIAKAMNDRQPALLPGQGFAWEFAAVVYRKSDYLSKQDRRNGDRDCDRRIFQK